MSRNLLLFLVIALFSFVFPLQGQQANAMPKPSAPAKAETLTGTVVETMDAAGYTYMLVDNGAAKTWVAIPATPVKKGATVSYHQGMIMKKFTSKSLNRTFDDLVFSAGLAGGEAEAATKPPAEGDTFSAAVKAEQGSTGGDAPAMETSGGSAGAIVPLKELSIPKATGEGGYTVEEIFAKAKELSGKKVRVHGKVVKVSPMIMGKNWLHLQDGTGNPMDNSHDLVVTTEGTVKVDSIVTVEGQLAAEKDFGAGYKYAAIVEDATITE